MIIPYIMENIKCLKLPTSYILCNTIVYILLYIIQVYGICYIYILYYQITIVIPRTRLVAQPCASALPLAAWVGSVESGPQLGPRGARARPGSQLRYPENRWWMDKWVNGPYSIVVGKTWENIIYKWIIIYKQPYFRLVKHYYVNLRWVETNPNQFFGINGNIYVHQQQKSLFAGYLRLAMDG